MRLNIDKSDLTDWRGAVQEGVLDFTLDHFAVRISGCGGIKFVIAVEIVAYRDPLSGRQTRHFLTAGCPSQQDIVSFGRLFREQQRATHNITGLPDEECHHTVARKEMDFEFHTVIYPRRNSFIRGQSCIGVSSVSQHFEGVRFTRCRIGDDRPVMKISGRTESSVGDFAASGEDPRSEPLVEILPKNNGFTGISCQYRYCKQCQQQ